MIDNNDINNNNIKIPWYQSPVLNNVQEKIAISNIKFNINIPPSETPPKEEENPQEEEAKQSQESKAKEPITNAIKGKVPNPFPFPKPNTIPNPLPFPLPFPPVFAAQNSTEIIPKNTIVPPTWKSLTKEQQHDYLLRSAKSMQPQMDTGKLINGIKIIIDWDWSKGGAGKLYNNLVLECGVLGAIILMIIVGGLMLA
jgi:hypothetical protein